MRIYEKNEPKHLKGEPYEKKWKARNKGYEVIVETRVGKREDFKWKSTISAIKSLTNPSENTTIIDITRIIVETGCDDITAKMCVRNIIKNLHGNNILILVRKNTLFDEIFFEGLGFKKFDKWLIWQHSKIYIGNSRWYDEQIL